MADITCTRCGETRARQAFQPFQNELGRRVFAEICAVCWGEWLKHQTALINHYALNLRDRQAKEFLFQQMEEYLYSRGAET